MPVAMEHELKKAASKLASKGKLKSKKGMTLQQAENAYVYGTMRKHGWKPKKEKKY